MKFWDNIVSGLKARKGEFTGTSGNEASISKRVDNNKSVNISNPTSYRTYQNVGEGTLNEDDVDVGLTSGKGAELASTAIKNIEFDPASENAKITFTSSDKQYDYPMTPEEFRSFLTADSKGRWVNKEARKYY
jgi:hypothetical protein